jgi:4'-phosphopantetheinyl transferase
VTFFCLKLTDFDDQRRRLEGFLSPEERVRAERFHRPEDRKRYVVRRGMLRELVAQHLNRQPSEIEFQYNALGKPSVICGSGEPELQFNMSHSEDWAIYALTRSGPIGVDIQCIRPIPDLERIASETFSPAELAAWTALPADSRLVAFFAAWTRKEAVLKAVGAGIGEGLKQVEVTLGLRDARVLQAPPTPDRTTKWRLHSFSPAPQTIAAIALAHN